MSAPNWIRYAPHSHNGLLDLLVTVGAIGTALYIWAMCVDPWRRIQRLPTALRNIWEPTTAGLMAYALVHSLMEGKMFFGQSIEWMILVLGLGISLRLTVLVRDEDRSAAGKHPRRPARARGDS